MCAFGVVGKILLDEQDLMEFNLVRFGFKNVGDIDFKVISATEIVSPQSLSPKIQEELKKEDSLTNRIRGFLQHQLLLLLLSVVQKSFRLHSL